MSGQITLPPVMQNNHDKNAHLQYLADLRLNLAIRADVIYTATLTDGSRTPEALFTGSEHSTPPVLTRFGTCPDARLVVKQGHPGATGDVPTRPCPFGRGGRRQPAAGFPDSRVWLTHGEVS